MYVPINDSHTEGYGLLSKLAILMVNGMIFFYGVEAIVFMSSLGGYYKPIYYGVIELPIFIILPILLLLHPLFMLPSLIASFFYRNTNSKGFFVFSILFNVINAIYVLIMVFVYIIPWTLSYIEIIS